MHIAFQKVIVQTFHGKPKNNLRNKLQQVVTSLISENISNTYKVG